MTKQVGTVSNNPTNLPITQKNKIDIFMDFLHHLTSYLIKFFDLILYHRESLAETPFVNCEDGQFSNWALQFHWLALRVGLWLSVLLTEMSEGCVGLFCVIVK